MKQWIKNHKGWTVVGILFLSVYFIFAVTRYSGHTTFIPFTGRVLNIDMEDIDLYYIQSGTSGEIISYTDADEIKEITDRLNGFRYICWLPKNPIPAGGWTYRVVLDFSNGTKESYHFGRTWLEVRGVRYFSIGDYFSQWAEALDNAR